MSNRAEITFPSMYKYLSVTRDKQRIITVIFLNGKTHYCDKKPMSTRPSALILLLCVRVQSNPGREADSAPWTAAVGDQSFSPAFSSTKEILWPWFRFEYLDT